MRSQTGQHITMAGNLHIIEQCDIENVTVHGDSINSHHAGLDAAFARGVRDARKANGNWYRSIPVG